MNTSAGNITNVPSTFCLTTEQFTAVLELKHNMNFAENHEVLNWVRLGLALFGLLTNAMNIVILTRPSMSSSINILLMAIEIFNVHFYLEAIYIIMELNSANLHYSYTNGFASNLFVFTNETTKGICSWLTVTVAIWRLLAVKDPLKVEARCGKSRTKKVILGIVLASLVLAIPFTFVFKISKFELPICRNGTLTAGVYYEIAQTDYASNNFWLLWMCYFLVCSTTSIPCAVLGISNVFLIFHLVRAKQARKAMTTNNARSEIRISLTLMVLLVLYFVTYLPESVISVMVMSLQFKAVRKLPKFVRHVTPMMTLFTNSTTVFFYAFMSENYRKTFYSLVKVNCNKIIAKRSNSGISCSTLSSQIAVSNPTLN